MAPFRYEHYRNPYAGSIGEMLLHQNDPQARAAETIGQAQARAAEMSGNAWGSALANIGQTVAAIPQQVTAYKANDQRQKMQELQLSEQQRAISQRDLLSKVIRETPQLDEDGVSLYDVPAVAKALAAVGVEPGEAVKQLGAVNDAFRAEKSAKLALIKRGAEGVIAAGNDPTLAAHFLDQLEKNGSFSKEQVDQYRAFIEQDPENNVSKLTAALVGKRDLMTVAPGATVVDKGTGKDVYTAPERPSVVAGEARAEAAQKETARHNLEQERIAGLTAGRAEAAAAETKRHNGAMERIQQQKVTNAANDKTELTDAGLDAAALNFAKTGTLPPLGMGDKHTRVRIINRAAEMMPGLDVASAKADFQANQTSLTKLQAQRDAVTAFERTASRNIDIFLETAGKVVDTGSPYLNTPVRAVTGRMLGSTNQADYDAARQAAVTEIAKVIQNPNLAGQLSDTARKEVEAFNPANATLKQSVSVMRLLKREMAGRTDFLDDALAGIRTRIKNAGQPPPDAGSSVTVQTPKGAFTFPTQAAADEFKKKAGIK